MARTTYQTFLMKGSGATPSTYTKLVDIKSYGDLGGTPESLDKTTLSDSMRLYLPGIQDAEALTFECNYDPTDFQALKALEGVETPYAVWFGADSTGAPDGSDGKFAFSGSLSVFVPGGGVNEIVNMTVTIMPTTVIEFSVGE